MEHEPSKLGTTLAWGGLALITAFSLIRAMVEHDPFPWWQTDPFVFSPPVIGLTPTKALVLNLAVVLSASLTLIGFFIRRDRITKPSAVLMVIGVAAISSHGIITFESFLDGSNLLAIVSVLYVASYAHKLVDAQRLIIATTLGFVVLLVTVGVYEVFVVHPHTIANYQQTRESFLAARGWAPGSFEALAYERRLFQAEPIAWFGLTNVFASFTGAGAAGLLMLGWGTRATATNRHRWTIYLLAGIIGLLGLLLTGAKGGIGAFVLGLGLAAIARLFTRKTIDGRALVGVCGLVVLGVVARGFIGERIGELSLLFRSQYITGSMRMFIGDPIFGVGPGAFQEHYAYVKPALSPEDVASAHSIPFDLIATLGLGGIALVVVLISVLARIRPKANILHTDSALTTRQLTQLTLLVIAGASVVSIRFAAPAMDINLIMVQFLAIAVWMGVAVVVVRGKNQTQALRWASFAAASVLAIHSMIEVSASWFVSGMLWALMIGSACTISPRKTDREARRDVMTIVVAFSFVFGVAVFGGRLATVAKWEAQLQIAAQPAIQVARLRGQLNELEHAPIPSELRAQIANELAGLLDRRVDDSIDSILSGLNQIEFDGRRVASEHLIRAAQIRPTHMQTRIAASQQILWGASVLDRVGRREESSAAWDQALELLEAGVERSTGAGGYQWLGNVWYGRAMQFPDDPERIEWLDQAQRAWMEAYIQSPHNPHLVLKMMDLAIELGETTHAMRLARQVILLHEQSRLDPLKGLNETDLIRVRAIAQLDQAGTDSDGP